MSNVGLGNLTELKRELLEPAQRTETRWDLQIAAIGTAVTRMFERHCGSRLFGRDTAAVEDFTADRAFYIARRYPVESITSLTQRDDLVTGFVALDANTTWNLHPASGLLEFGTLLGPRTSIVRMTYIGGFWFDTSEDATGALPSGATALPSDISQAWYLQCQHVFQKRDAISQAQILGAAKDKPDTGGVKLLEIVEEMLAPHRRMNL